MSSIPGVGVQPPPAIPTNGLVSTTSAPAPAPAVPAAAPAASPTDSFSSLFGGDQGGFGKMLLPLLLMMMMMLLLGKRNQQEQQPAFDIDSPVKQTGSLSGLSMQDRSPTTASTSGGGGDIQRAPILRRQQANSVGDMSHLNTTSDASDRAALNNTLNRLAGTEDGAKLLQKVKEMEAEGKKVSIRVGNPDTAIGANDRAHDISNCSNCQTAKDAGKVTNGVTISNPTENKYEIVIRDPNNIKTLGHELGHLTTSDDGNSKLEEGNVEALGRKIEAEANGSFLNNSQLRQIANNKMALYGDLNGRNNIKDSLASMGISAVLA